MHQTLTIAVMRGELRESEHHADAVVRTADGGTTAVFGDGGRAVYPRSAIKPLQALPLVESGAADACGLDDARLALACASHDHESVHLEAVRAWLRDIGASVSDLACGLQPPDDAETIAALARRGEQADAVYNNCSGKHTGLLCVARHLGEPLAGYTDFGHPVQRRLRRVLAEVCDADTEHAPWGWDGCSIPTLALPLSDWALGMARLACPQALGEPRAGAARRLSAAIAAHPRMIGGEHSWDTQLIRATGGRLLVKRGAEGVACGWLPGEATGFAIKVHDGAARAVQVAVGRLARLMGWLDADTLERCAALFQPGIGNWNGYRVGRLVPVDG